MTISNIFNGKKVVKQIKLGQTIIYQSKGWTALPVSLTKNWYISNTNGQITNLEAGSNGDIYYSVNNVIYKTDLSGNTPVKAITGSTTIKTFKVDKDNNDAIYACYNTYIAKYIKNELNVYIHDLGFGIADGENIIYEDINVSREYGYYFYQNTYNSYFTLVRFNKNTGSILATLPMVGSPLTPLIFSDIGIYTTSSNIQNIYLYPFDFTSNTQPKIVISIGKYNYIQSLASDSIGYLYISCTDGYIYKFDNQGNQMFTVKNQSSITSNIIFDSNDNFYVCYFNNSYYPTLYEYSNSGTYMTSFITDAGISTLPAIDSNDNIYVPQTGGGLYQLFNIQKEE